MIIDMKADIVKGEQWLAAAGYMHLADMRNVDLSHMRTLPSLKRAMPWHRDPHDLAHEKIEDQAQCPDQNHP